MVLFLALLIVDFFFAFGLVLSSGLALPALARPVFFSGAMNLVFGFFGGVGGGGDGEGLGASVAGSVAAGEVCGVGGVVAGEKAAGVGGGDGGDLLWRAVGDDAATAFAAFGAHVEDVVGVADDVEIVLDDD